MYIIRLFFLLLSTAKALAFPSSSSTALMRTPALSSRCSLRPLGPSQILPSMRFRATSAYSTKIYLTTKECYGDEIIHPMSTWRRVHGSSSRRRNSCRFLSSDENVEDENIHGIDSNQNITDGDGNTTNATINTNKEENLSLGMESGWADFGRSLLPSWAYLTPSSNQSVSSSLELDEEIGSNTDENETRVASESNLVHTPKFSPNSTKDDAEGGAVIDVDARVDESEYNATTTAIDVYVESAAAEPTTSENNNELTRHIFRGTTAAFLQGGKKLLKLGKRIRDNRNDDISSSTIDIESNPAVIGDTASPPEETILGNFTKGENASNIESTGNSSDPNSLKRHRGTRRRQSSNDKNTPASSPIFSFTSLESKDIDTTTRSKQKKWARRRKRAIVLFKTTKNAAFLFVVTFLLGNVSTF